MLEFCRLFVYLIKEGFKNTWSNILISLISLLTITSCLFIMGISYLVSENIKLYLKNIENKDDIMIFLKTDNHFDSENIREKLCQISNISSCEFYSKDDAVEECLGFLGGSVDEYFQENSNPLPDAFRISMRDLSEYNQTINKIKEIEEVDSVSDHSKIAKQLSNLKKIVNKISVFIIIMLSVISFIIILSTIRTTLRQRSFEMKIMKSIGATNAFIRIPFMIEGMLLGFIASGIAILVLRIVYEKMLVIINNISPFNAISFSSIYPRILLFYLLIGFMFGISSGFVSTFNSKKGRC
ncbi:MAG: FtsX-like permease family protein [Candidatus Improbicoccus pseudotrichonymphae]|uniref:Cell division protein FtsX n=1 Tax=Candidatus Improbicoccus pseudotrichonymphae TaxID=3033792 RepID=A0AA48IB44_9FIRM|nr:MAG: FtsX-like permease family protein [Candidatus Improbicoccus pseudotrichonymphae]